MVRVGTFAVLVIGTFAAIQMAEGSLFPLLERRREKQLQEQERALEERRLRKQIMEELAAKKAEA